MTDKLYHDGLIAAIRSNNPLVVALLVNLDMDMNIATSTEALELAVGLNRPDIVALLLQDIKIEAIPESCKITESMRLVDQRVANPVSKMVVEINPQSIEIMLSFLNHKMPGFHGDSRERAMSSISGVQQLCIDLINNDIEAVRNRKIADIKNYRPIFEDTYCAACCDKLLPSPDIIYRQIVGSISKL